MTFVDTILHHLAPLSKPRRAFLASLYSALLAFGGRATFQNLSRFGVGSPKRVARHFARPLDWPTLAWQMLRHCQITSHRLFACLDATFLPKSGTHTYGVAWFHRGVTGRVERGCEAIHLGLVDRDERTAYTLSVDQTPASSPEGDTRLTFYTAHLLAQAEQLLAHEVQHVVTDGYFAKLPFVKPIVEAGLHVVGKLRKDSRLRYLYAGPHVKRPGRRKQFDGAVDLKTLSRFSSRVFPRLQLELWWCIVNSPCLERSIRVVVVRQQGQPIEKQTILYTTDLTLEPVEVMEMYRERFQQEYLFRDGKQHLGFADGQMRDATKRKEHLNATMWALNLVRLEDRNRQGAQEPRVISIAKWKRRAMCRYAGEQILARSGHRADRAQIEALLDELAPVLDLAA